VQTGGEIERESMLEREKHTERRGRKTNDLKQRGGSARE